MLNLTQVVSLIIAVLLTGMFLVIGYQFVQILQQLKETITKTNKILDDAGRVTESVADPVVSLSGFLTGLKDGSKLISLFMGKDKSNKS